ncbi:MULTISPECIES: VOC family protein [Rhodomicrobium]|uniref:VOC family protein n=1 Tax=Rhodomicrobium TaxID=1068 RepID=UPI001AED01EE|nr:MULTISPECIES: VOC family protein [Rhodomicrobium]
MPACELDHIVIAAASLEDGADFIRERLGIEIPAGGRHESMGTHNRLMRLGANRYLEVIAVNPAATPPTRPRWYALDEPQMRARLENGPALIAWVLRTADIIAAVQAAAVPLGAVTSVSRGMLSWRLTVPDDGHLPGDGVIPHLIEWDGGARPWEALPDEGFWLQELTLTHPDAAWLTGALRTLCARGFSSVKVAEGEKPGLSAKIVTPAGETVTI